MEETITPGSLKKNLQQYFIIDVREADEFAEGHITGAVNIPLGRLIRDLGKGIVPIDKPVVVHCKSGGRGAIALEVLKKRGFTHVQNLIGGFEAWKCNP